jgi:hypothetical protein
MRISCRGQLQNIAVGRSEEKTSVDSERCFSASYNQAKIGTENAKTHDRVQIVSQHLRPVICMDKSLNLQDDLQALEGRDDQSVALQFLTPRTSSFQYRLFG